MAVIIISFQDKDGNQYRDDVVVEGNCTQHLNDNLAYDAVCHLIANREVFERNPNTYKGGEEFGMASNDNGNVAIARWAEDQFKFKP